MHGDDAMTSMADLLARPSLLKREIERKPGTTELWREKKISQASWR